MKKCHKWSSEDDSKLKTAIEECSPIFEHYREQNKSYNESNAWDAVAGRLLPGVCVTGAACRRRWEILKEDEQKEDSWKQVSDVVDKYERDLMETTFDGVSEMLGNQDAIFERLKTIELKLNKLLSMWE